ncbi:MAG: DNA repair protein RecO [Candidatus Peribacteraceae bacterium]
MSRTYTDRAIVLRTWSIGETDRFCVVLTREHGRIPLRVAGARRLLSRRGRGLLPLHIVDVTWTERDSMCAVDAASCAEPNHTAWQNIESLAAAEKGIELLMNLTEDRAPVPEIFDLTADFLGRSVPGPEATLILYALKVLDALGHFPSITHAMSTGHRFSADQDVVWSRTQGGFVPGSEDPYGLTLTPTLRSLLSEIETLSFVQPLPLTASEYGILRRMLDHYSPIQLGTSFASTGTPSPRILASSSKVTPT